MRRAFLLAIVSGCFGGPIIAATCVAADSAAGKTAAKVLIEKGWDKSAAGKALVDHPKLGEPALAGDSMVLAARWMVLLYQGRYDDALVVLDKFLNVDPAEDLKLAALRAKAWILTVKKNYRQAMVVADQIAQAATPNPPRTEPRVLEAEDEGIAFVGRLVGFIEGPCEKVADQNVRAKLEERVLQRIDEGRKKIFADAKAAVLEEFTDLVEGAAEAKVDSKTATEIAKEEQLKKLSDDNSKLAKDASKIEDQGKKLADDAQKRLNELKGMDAPLVQRFMLLQGQLTTLNTRLDQQQALVRQYSKQDNSSNAYGPPSTNSPALTRAQSELANLQTQINMTNNEMVLLQQKHNEIQQQMVAIGGAAQVQDLQLKGKLQNLEREKLRVENKKKKADKKKGGAPAKALALEAEARAFSTYDDFPLEEARNRLLELLQ